MAEIEELETRVADLEAQVVQALEIARQHGKEHTEEGFDPAILKQRQIIGSLLLARSNADLTLTTSNQDVASATLTLPHIGLYAVDAVFDFRFTAVPASGNDTNAIGVLTNSSDVEETGVAILGVPTVDDNDNMRATVTQQWIITTTAIDTVYKLRARKDQAVGTVECRATHTTIRALYIGRDIA